MTELLTFFGIVLVAWLLFAFVAEGASPFKRPGSRLSRRRWLLGRRLALAWVVGSGIAWAALVVTDIAPSVALGVLAVPLLLVLVPAAASRLRRKARDETDH